MNHITCSMSCEKPAEIHLQCSHVLSVVASLLKGICFVLYIRHISCCQSLK